MDNHLRAVIGRNCGGRGWSSVLLGSLINVVRFVLDVVSRAFEVNQLEFVWRKFGSMSISPFICTPQRMVQKLNISRVGLWFNADRGIVNPAKAFNAPVAVNCTKA